MTQPSVSAFTDELYDRLAPLAQQDADYGYALLHVLESGGSQVSDVYDWTIAAIDDGEAAWSQLVTIEDCPEEFLPWLGQMKGARLLSPDTMTEQEKRDFIDEAPMQARGRPATIEARVKALLTGDKWVEIRERYDANNPTVDSPDYMHVMTLTSETADPAAVEALLNDPLVKPAGLWITYEDVAVRDFDDLDTDYADFDAVDAAYSSFDELREDV